MTRPFRIGIVAPGTPIDANVSEPVREIAARRAGRPVELVFHPQCFETEGHFAGGDERRFGALVDFGNDPDLDAVWFARGGYGACRIASAAIAMLGPAARAKQWLGYSDAGFLLAGLARAGFTRIAHGPMPVDIVRAGGAAAVGRALDWLVDGDPSTVESSVTPGQMPLAFNLCVLSQLMGTPLEPDFSGRVLMIEEVGEYLYRIDRFLYHVSHQPAFRDLAGVRLGRCSDIPDNVRPFGETPVEIVRRWCEQAGVPFLGRADIGHDAGNRIVPFTVGPAAGGTPVALSLAAATPDQPKA